MTSQQPEIEEILKKGGQQALPTEVDGTTQYESNNLDSETQTLLPTKEAQKDSYDLKKTSWRWCMLFMACSFLLGSCFSYDGPGPLATQLQQQFHISSTKYSLLYTVYSLPNMILPVLGGVFLDRIGIRSGLLLFCFILSIGQFVFMIGGYQTNFNEMLVGRTIFGMGGECMAVAQSSIISVWFKGKELAFALGLNMSVARLGSVINAAIIPTVYDQNGLGAALLVGFVLCLFSLANAFGLVFIDKKAEKTSEATQESQEEKEDSKFKWSDLYSFPLSYWFLTFSCLVTYMSIFPFIQISSDLLQTKFHFDKITAGYLFGVPYVISSVSSPFLGLLIDKIGKRAFLICLSSIILIVGFLSSMMMPECHQCYNEVFPLVLTGIGYSIYAAAIWGSIPYVVAPSTVGTAFGITTAIQNIGLVVAPTIVGEIKDMTADIDHGFFWVNAFFVTINVVGLILNLSLYYQDIYYHNGILDKVPSDAKKEPSDEKEAIAGEETASLLTKAD